MKFSELACCPFCGNEEFYTKEYAYGTLFYAERFDGKEAENAELYEGLNFKNYSGRAYCRSCGRYLGNREQNIVGKVAYEKIKRSDNNAE